MPTVAEQEILNRVELFQALRSDPSLMLKSGMLLIDSPYKCDKAGVPIVSPDKKGGGADLTGPFYPNVIQRRILRTRKEFLKDGQPFNCRVLKARSIGATTLFNSLIVACTATTQGSRSIIVSHEPASASKIYSMARQMLTNLPEWIRPELVLSSVIRLEASNPQWGISHSSITSTHSEAIDSIVGDRCLIMFKDEAARYRNAEDVFTATNSMVVNSIAAMSIEATTSFGHEEHFYPHFMESWRHQGDGERGMNVWESGAKRYRRSSVSMFFPWFWDDTKQAALPKEVSAAWLLGDMDDYERELFREHLMPFLKTEAEALKRIYWRRSKILSEYRYMPAKALVASHLLTKEKFCREEPATVEEAFDVVGTGVVIPEFILDEIRRRDRQQPIAKGIVADGRFMEKQVAGNQETVWLWKSPGQIKGRMIAAIDPSAGIFEDERPEWTNARDYTYGVFFEEQPDGKWEQVAEYVNQRPGRTTGPQLRSLCDWLASNEEERLPEVCIERSCGMDVLAYFLESEYPPWKMYRQLDDTRVGRQAGSFWGFNPASTKNHVSSVQYWANLICAGKMIVHSERLMFQFGNFVQVSDKKYQAINKGKSGANSKDDGVDACCMVAYVIENSPPGGVTLDAGATEGTALYGGSGSLFRHDPHERNWLKIGQAMLAATAAGIEYDSLPTKEQAKSRLVPHDTFEYDTFFGGSQ